MIWGRLKTCLSRSLRIREYLLAYSKALKLEQDGTHVVVYMDESYCHQRHASGYTWSLPGQNRVRTGGGKGLRLIIVHAITKDGLLFDPGSERRPNDTEVIEPCKTSEWIFLGPVKKGDYHKNMNSRNFMNWVNDRLFPAFNAKYPNKKMVLVLDNAPYHHGRAPNYIDPLQLKREKLITELLLTAGQENMQVNRKGTIRSFNLKEALQQKRGGRIHLLFWNSKKNFSGILATIQNCNAV